MAPRYAPQIRKHLFSLAFILEIVIISVFAVFFSYEVTDDATAQENMKVYPEFQDLHVILFLSFGCLMAFLRQYGFSGMGFSLLIAALGVQCSLLMDGFLFHLQDWTTQKIQINIDRLVMANLSTVSALISMGALIGKANPVQLLFMTVLEVIMFSVNKWALYRLLEIKETSSIKYVHIFGAYFGVMASWLLYNSGLRHPHEKEESKWRSDLFSMLGTLFQWMFWPSFNSIFTAKNPADKQRVIASTYCALAVSTVVAFAISILSNKKGKLKMVHIRNATLAGGIALCSSADLIKLPWVAMTIGFIAALISTLGYKYLKPLLQSTFQVHDTCGVLWLFGFPGLMGGLARIILLTMDHPTQLQLVADKVLNEFASICMTAATSLVAGLLTGFILKCRLCRAPQPWKYFDDQAYWEFPNQAYKL